MSAAASNHSLRRLALSLTALAAALLLAEVGLRALRLGPERYAQPQWSVWQRGAFHASNIGGNGLIKRPSRFAGDGVIMGEYVPGAIFKCRFASNPNGYFDADNGVVMTVNHDGMRGGGWEPARPKPPGVRRILVLGDSFTFGAGVRDGETFCREVERRLNGDTVQGGGPVEVLNAGVQGYNTRDEVLYLERQWLALEPDLVLIVFYINDAYSDTAIRNRGQELGIYDPPPSGLARHSRVWDTVRHWAHARRAAREVEALYRNPYFQRPAEAPAPPGEHQADWPASRAALARAAELARTHGFRLALVIFPDLYRLDDRHPFTAVYDLVAAAARQDGMPVLDLFRTTFAGRDARRFWVHPSDHHPNRDAHALAGEAIARFVEDQRLLQPDPRPPSQQ